MVQHNIAYVLAAFCVLHIASSVVPHCECTPCTQACSCTTHSLVCSILSNRSYESFSVVAVAKPAAVGPPPPASAE
eukprot:20900-Heterococcus_DN1.PRE.2